MRLAAAVLVIVLCWPGVTAQQAKPAPAPAAFTPTPEQALRLTAREKDAVIAYQAAEIAQQQLVIASGNYRAAFAAINAEAEKVKAENKWAPEVLAQYPDPADPRHREDPVRFALPPAQKPAPATGAAPAAPPAKK